MRHRFSAPLQVRFADTDAQGHVFFANYLTFADEGMTAYMRAIGCPWQELIAMGVDIFYVSSKCDYKGSAKFDTTLDLHTRIGRIGNTSMDTECSIYSGDELIAEAVLTSVFIDTETREPVRVPDRVRDAVAAYEGAS
jgi:acyl-CoA thioester hydrolase